MVTIVTLLLVIKELILHFAALEMYGINSEKERKIIFSK